MAIITKPQGITVRITTAIIILGLGLSMPANAADGGGGSLPTIDPHTVPCTKVTADEMAKFVGAPAKIRETSENLCAWQGSKAGAYVEIAYFSGKSRGVPPGQERAYFDQMIDSTRASSNPNEVVELSGIGESAWALKPSGEPPNYFAVFLFANTDNMTISSSGVGYEETVEIARLAASRL